MLIITIEGVDQAGKALQSAMLADALKAGGIDVELFNFPDYTTPLGQDILECLHDPKTEPHTIHAMLAENRKERLDDIASALKKKRVLVMNRYCESNIVYGLAHGLSRDSLYRLDLDMPKSDMTILLDISTDESFRRKNRRDIFEADREFMKRVVEIYRDEARRGGWTTVDGERAAEKVQADIQVKVLDFLKGRLGPTL